MKDSIKKLEIAANCGIVLVSLLLGVVLLKDHFLPRRAASPDISPGAKLALSQVDWEAHGETLVLALQKGCHFCTDSAPFYRRLAQEATMHGKAHLVAILPTAADESQSYLAQLGVSIPEIRQAPLSAIQVSGTPTLILVDHKGVVLRVWSGELPPEKEQEVLKAIS